MTTPDCTHDYKYWGYATHPSDEGPETMGVYQCAKCGEFTVKPGLPIEVQVAQLAKALIRMQEMCGGPYL